MFLILLSMELMLAARLVRAETIGGDVGAGVPEAGAHALAGALAAASVESSTGVLRSTLPITLPSARGAAQPELALTYSSAAGVREAGAGWGLSMPVIERSTKNGGPNYGASIGKPANFSQDTRITKQDPKLNYDDDPDELLFNGGRLVPICEVGATERPCNTTDPDSPFPAWLGNAALLPA
jgi:hypothetical protein